MKPVEEKVSYKHYTFFFLITVYIHVLSRTEVQKPGFFIVKDDMSYASDCVAPEVKLYVFCNVALEENDWTVSFFDCLLGKELLVSITYLGGWLPTQSVDIVLCNMKGKLALCML